MRSKKAIVNVISSLMLQLVTIICGFIVPRLIIQNFGSNVNGLISSITQFLAYITLLESGFGPVVKSILYKPIAKKDKEEIKQILKSTEKFFKKISYIFAFYIIILCFAYPIIIGNQFDTIFTVSLVVIISISTFAEYYFGMTYKLYLQAEQKTYITSIIQIATTIANTILIIVLVYLGSNIQIVKLASAIIFVLRPILQNIYVKKKYNIDLKDVEGNYQIKQKWDGLAQHIAFVIHNNTDVVILTLFSSTIEVSVYSVYLLVVNGVKNLVHSLVGGIDASFGDMIAKGEKDTLRKNFRIYELLYFTIITIVFSCTLVLILPFISVYTKGIVDANYYRPLFAYLIVLAEFVWTIRLPYNSITLAAGHFKQTRNGAWVESFTNIIISIILVFRFGIDGVAIGTLIAMIIRTAEFIWHTSKYVLEIRIKESIKRIAILIIEVAVSAIIGTYLGNLFTVNSYFMWIIEAIIIAILTALIVIPTNFIVYKKDAKECFQIIRNILSKPKNKTQEA